MLSSSSLTFLHGNGDVIFCLLLHLFHLCLHHTLLHSKQYTAQFACACVSSAARNESSGCVNCMCSSGGRHLTHLFVQEAGCRAVGADDVLQASAELLHRVEEVGGCRRSRRLSFSTVSVWGGSHHIRLGRHQHLSCFH